MRRIITLFLFLLTISIGAFAQMSDDQVIQYVKEGQKSGLTQKQMTADLMKRGVTKEQVERIQAKFQNTQGGEAKPQEATSRVRAVVSEGGVATDSLALALPVETILNKSQDGKQVFGRNVFSNKNLTFEPNINVATPLSYRLGPGDEVIIDVWGASQNTIRQVISPEGSIMVENLGPVYLNGMTVKDANSYLQREFSKIYSGIQGNASQIKLTLGEVRSIQVSIMGEAVVPGTYILSSFSTVFHALYRAGGVNDIGSLRNIQVMRGGKKVADVDVYDYILHGKLSDDVRLMEGDVILVPPYDCLVNITGKVKRPMYYELTKNETIGTLLKYTGGFTGDAYSKTIRLIRMSGREKQIYNVDEMDYSVFKLMDRDFLEVGKVLDRYENRVEIRGAVYRDGLYQLGGEVNTIKALIKKAEGLRGDAFLDRVQLQREHDDLSLEMISIDLRGMLSGNVADIPLQRNDVLYIPSVQDLKEQETLTIHGQVANPGTFQFAANMTVQDLIVMAGGLLESASTAKVDVARRIKDPKSNTFNNRVGENFSFELKNGLVISGDEDFHLQPFDEVYVRRSPAYYAQQNVAIAGEVLFEGNYSMSKKNERLSDLVSKAGGVTPDAYIRGARLLRKATEEELRRKKDMLRLTSKTGSDSISLASLDLSNVYPVGIDLQKALDNPGSDHDMVLRAGDMLYVPELVSTVKINGDVMYPNTVLYQPGEKVSYYINQAGGYGTTAKKSKAYVIYMNGTVARLKSGNSKMIEPGCEIIVPSKDVKKKMSAAEIIGMGTSAASLATMVATMVNLFK